MSDSMIRDTKELGMLFTVYIGSILVFAGIPILTVFGAIKLWQFVF